PGPRKARATADTEPNVTRVPPPGVAAAPKTSVPTGTSPPSAQSSAFAPPVSTEMTARSPSTSIPASWPRVERPSANVTVTSSPRTLWALVRTRPSARITPDPRCRDPIPTIEPLTRSETEVMAGPRRFNELQDGVGGIAPNILTERLRRLEREGVVLARPYSERPPRMEYQLSSAGRDLAGALRLLADWGARRSDHADPVRHSLCRTPLEARCYCP